MKSIFNTALVVFLTGLAASAAASPEGAQRAAALLDYIAADYGGAVVDGRVTDRGEYDEQVEFLGTIRTLLAGLETPAEVTTGLQGLEASIKALKPAPEVAAQAKAVRRAIIAGFGIVQAPTGPPDAARGAHLFLEQCAHCHGDDGSGQTPASAAFTIKPPDFRDPAAALARSPFRAFNTVTFGLEGTPMNAFSHLSDEDRWHLAFHVQALAHGGAKPDGAAPEPGPSGFDATLANLAAHDDRELRAKLGADADRVLPWLRATAPYQARPAGGLDVVRARLAAAQRALSGGDRAAARLAVLDAYLEGFEPIEARVSALDRALVVEVEQAFSRARAGVEAGEPAPIADLLRLVERVEARLADSGGGTWASLFVASAVILLREGLEVVLLIGVILTLLSRMGREDARRWVHGGWIAALVAGVATWFAASFLIVISGRSREVLEGVVALVAAGVLLFVSHWFLAAAEKQRWIGFLRGKLATQLGSGRMLPLFGLAFLAVYREAFETVLFYQALLLDSPGGTSAVLAGLGAGALGVAALAVLILRAGRKLPLGPLFTGSGLVLCALCVVFVGQGLQALREAGVLEPRPLDLPSIPWLGLFPDTLGLLSQLATVALIVGLLLLSKLRPPRSAPAA